MVYMILSSFQCAQELYYCWLWSWKQKVNTLIHAGNWDSHMLLDLYGPILTNKSNQITIAHTSNHDTWIWKSDHFLSLVVPGWSRGQGMPKKEVLRALIANNLCGIWKTSNEELFQNGRPIVNGIWILQTLSDTSLS